MKTTPSLAYQRKRPRFKSNKPVGMAKPANGTAGGASDNQDDEDPETPTSMEARTQEAEAAYHFADQHDGSAPPAPRETPDAPESAEPNADVASTDPAALRREQEKQRRDQERDRRENERKERDRRENERRDNERKDRERKDRERLQEIRNIDIDSVCSKAWDIYSAEVKEEGVELFPDNDARELCKRSFRLAEIFLLEEARLRKLRSEPSASEPTPEPVSEAAPEPTMGE